MASRFDYLTRTVIPDVPNAPSGGGFRGFLNRLGTGARQGATPNTPLQIAARSLNPVAGTLGAAATEGFRDAVTGSSWYQRLFGNEYDGVPATPMGMRLPAYFGEGGTPHNDNSARRTMGYGVDNEGNTIVPRWPWESDAGGENERLVGDGQGPRRDPNVSPPTPARGVGARGGEVIARRIAGDDANNRALEAMAENMLGQSATQRQAATAQQARQAMNQMFGRQFK